MLHVYTFNLLRSGCWDVAEAQSYLDLVWRSVWELPCDPELLEFSLAALEWGPTPDDLICVVEGVTCEPKVLDIMAWEAGVPAERLRLKPTPTWVTSFWRQRGVVA